MSYFPNKFLQNDSTSTTAANVSFEPSATVSSTNVQNAIDEISTSSILGPAISDINGVARYGNTTGSLLKNSTVTISDDSYVTSNGSIYKSQAIAPANPPASSLAVYNKSDVLYKKTSAGVETEIGGNIFDQDLNTTDEVEFKTVTANEGVILPHIDLATSSPLDSGTLFTKDDRLLYLKQDDGSTLTVTNVANSSSGVKTGGIISVSSTTTIDISDGTGLIVGADDPVTQTQIEWTGLSNITITGLAAHDTTYICILDDSSVQQSFVHPTTADRRQKIFIGQIIHPSRTQIDNIANITDFLINPVSQIRDLASVFNILNLSGNTIAPSGSGLRFKKLIGEIFKYGSGYDTNPYEPNKKILDEIDTATTGVFQYAMSDGSYSGNLQNFNPDILDDGSAYPGDTMGGRKWGISRVYSFVSNNILIMPPQEEYKDKSSAIDAISDAVIETDIVKEQGMLICYIISEEGETDFNDASFIQVSKFGSLSGSSTTGTSTFQDIYEVSTSPQLITNSTQGPLSVQLGVGEVDAFKINDETGAELMNVSYTGALDLSGVLPSLNLTDNGDIIGSSTGFINFKASDGDVGSVKFVDDVLSLNNEIVGGTIDLNVEGKPSLKFNGVGLVPTLWGWIDVGSTANYLRHIYVGGIAYLNSVISMKTNDLFIRDVTGSDLVYIEKTNGNMSIACDFKATNSFGNILIGDGAGSSLANINYNNTCIGINSGTGLISGNYLNTFIGESSGTTSNSNFNSCIGAQANVSASNTMYGIALGVRAITDTQTCTIGSSVTNEHILAVRPGITDTCSLGSSSVKFKDLNVSQNVNIGDSSITFADDDITINNNVGTGDINFTITGEPSLRYDGDKFYCPSNHNLVDIGSSTKYFRSAYFGGSLYLNSTMTMKSSTLIIRELDGDEMLQIEPTNRNITMGGLAGANITSQNNIILGYETGQGLTTFAYNNVLIGDSVAKSVAGGSSAYENVIIGSNSADSMTTGNRNVLIGAECNLGGDAGNNRVCIGFGVTNSSNDTTVIGNSVNKSISPSITNGCDLGTPAVRFKNLYLSGDIHLDGTIVGQTSSYLNYSWDDNTTSTNISGTGSRFAVIGTPVGPTISNDFTLTESSGVYIINYNNTVSKTFQVTYSLSANTAIAGDLPYTFSMKTTDASASILLGSQSKLTLNTVPRSTSCTFMTTLNTTSDTMILFVQALSTSNNVVVSDLSISIIEV